MKTKTILLFLLYFSICPYLVAEEKNSVKKEKTETEKINAKNKPIKKTAVKKIPAEWIALKKELKSRKSALSSPVIQRRLERIHRAMNQKNNEQKAIELIEKLEEVVKNRPFELARLYRLKAQLYLSKDKFKKALSHYQKAIKLKRISYRDHLSILYDMATIHLLQNKTKKASQLIDKLFYLADTIPPSAYILKASLLIEQKKKKSALELVMKAIQSTGNPKESWLAMAAALNIEMEKYIKAIHLLTRLTASYPNKKKYWKQLSAVYLNLNKDSRALATLDLAYKLDFLETEKEILHLASLLMYQGLPFKAAHLLEKSIELKKVEPSPENLEILGDCWLRAEETKKSLKAYEQSAPSAEDGKIFFKLGRIYLSQQNWKAAAHNLTKALKKGGIKRLENLYISIGIAYINLKKYEEAIQSFEQVIATEAKGQHIKIARQWINYTQSFIKDSLNTASLDKEPE